MGFEALGCKYWVFSNTAKLCSLRVSESRDCKTWAGPRSPSFDECQASSSSAAPTTGAPTSAAPTTKAPTTKQEPTSAAPTTKASTTKGVPTTTAEAKTT